MAGKYLIISQKTGLSLAIAAALFGVTAFSGYLNRCYPVKNQDFFYIPSAQKLQPLASGIKTTLADIFYINGVMAVTDVLSNKEFPIKWVQDNMAAALLLDHNFTQAFLFAGAIIARDKATLLKGNEFLLTYSYLAPSDWHIPYWIGFNFYELGMYPQAIRFFQQASRFSDAPPFLQTNQSFFYYKANMARMGAAYFAQALETERNPQKIKWLKIKLEWLSHIVLLEDAVSAFKARFNRDPFDLNELIAKKILKAIPADSFGKGFYFDTKELRVKSQFK